MLRRVFLRDLVLPARIGVYEPELHGPQRIRVNVELGVTDPGGIGPDRLDRVVDYAALADTVRAVVGAGHVKLAETLAERLAEACLRDARVKLARVTVEKLDVLPDAVSAGVEVVRRAAKTVHSGETAAEILEKLPP